MKYKYLCTVFLCGHVIFFFLEHTYQLLDHMLTFLFTICLTVSQILGLYFIFPLVSYHLKFSHNFCRLLRSGVYESQGEEG